MKIISYNLSNEVMTVVGRIKSGMVFPVEDNKVADQLLMNAGFMVSTKKPTHKFDKDLNEWVEIKKGKED